VVLEEEAFAHGLKHAAGIVPMIERLCRVRSWKGRELQQVYVSAGPGSFTGLRIGMTLAKALAFATEAKIVAVGTARVLAENAPAQARHVVIVLDAKRDQIFTGRFECRQGKWVEREAAHLDTLNEMISRSPRPVYLIGEGIPYHRRFLAAGDESVMVTGEESWRARAGAVAKIGWEMAQREEFADAYGLVPIYVRRPEAEEKWKG
jgi:tRNA threonylcarbamoyladenosine biosynthesis protein TsaB